MQKLRRFRSLETIEAIENVMLVVHAYSTRSIDGVQVCSIPSVCTNPFGRVLQ